MQGHLRQPDPLELAIRTECACCGEVIHIEMDSELNYSVVEADAEPLIFMPSVNFDKLEDPSIIEAF